MTRRSIAIYWLKNITEYLCLNPYLRKGVMLMYPSNIVLLKFIL